MAHGEKGKTKLVNYLLDSGSVRSLIRTDVADELKLQGWTSDITVNGVNGLKVRIPDVRCVRFRLTPELSEGLESLQEGIELMALSLLSLCDDLVATLTPLSCKDNIPSLQLTEVTSGSVQIHVIIGIDAYLQVLGQGVRSGASGDPFMIETIFGWIVCGPMMRQTVDRQETTLIAQTEDSLSPLLRHLWEVEALGILPTTEDAKTEPVLTRLMNQSALTDIDIQSLRHWLARDSEKEREYTDVIQSYLYKGWAEEVQDESGLVRRTWYLPHHAMYQSANAVWSSTARLNLSCSPYLASEDPRDCTLLTPAHFLIGRELAALPTSTQEKSSLAGAKQLRRRWQYQQMLMRQLWKRWTEEYLVSLTVSGKYGSPQPLEDWSDYRTPTKE
ncbi:hypothetical protein T06_6910 [Trichinella sp. T6]|nr:hypothetical protein T06_6910 [Trichinella sp. T6]